MRPGHGRKGWTGLSSPVSRALSHATCIRTCATSWQGKDYLCSTQEGQSDQIRQLPKVTPQHEDPASSGPRSLLLQAAFQDEFRRIEDWVTVPEASRD